MILQHIFHKSSRNLKSQCLMNDLMQFGEVLFCLEFCNKKGVVFNLTSFGILKYDCVIKTIEILSFLPLINNSATARFSFSLINHISNHIRNY